MRLKLIQTKMKDFKCYQEKKVDYSKSNVTEIKGKNEQGKTTIADAFYDTFAKRDYALNANPNIRPKNKEDSIPSVTHICDIDGKETIICKIQKMSKSKTDENKITITNSYEINAVPKNETSFNAYLEELGLDFKKFIALSHPDAFLNQKQDEMRNVIFKLGSAQSDRDIAKLYDDTSDLANYLENYKLEEIEAMNKASIKKINEAHGSKGELTEKAIVSKQELLVEMDISEVELQKKTLENKIKDIDEKLSNVSSQSIEVSKLGQKEMELEFDKNEIDRKSNEEIFTNRNNLRDKLDHALSEFDRCLREIKTAEQKIAEKKELIKNAEDKKQSLIKEWKEVNNLEFDDSKWIFDDLKTVCSMCGQTLPNNEIDDLKATFEKNKIIAKEKFATDKLNRKSSIEIVGQKQKEIIKENQEEIQNLEEKLLATRIESNKYMDEKTFFETKLSTIPAKADMSLNADYQEKVKEIKAIQDKLSLLGNNEEYISKLMQLKKPLIEELEECANKIAKFSRNIDIEEQIEELKEKRIDYEQARADAEKILEQCKIVSIRKDDLLVAEINSHFQSVKWKLWDYQKNGEKKSICEPYFIENGIEKTLSNSMSGGTKIRAKIDICYSLQKFFNMYVPIFVDEASEIDRDKVPEVDTQIILLSRDDCDLTIC